MDFRSLLAFLAVTFGREEFDARSVSSLMRWVLREAFLSDPKLVVRTSRKTISNDLRRLYFMGFLKRRRVKRKCKTKSGKTCFRGYEYKYFISSQEWKYLKYLASGQ